jgi:hypothetical protein
MNSQRQIGRVLFDVRALGPPARFCDAGCTCAAAANSSGLLFSPRFLGELATGSPSRPNTDSSDVRFLTLIHFLQFPADPLPEFADFVRGLAFRLKLCDPKATALRILVGIANDNEVRANHAEH